LPVEADAALRVARAYCTRKATKIYSPSPYDLTQAQPSTSGGTLPVSDWSVNRITPLAFTPLLHAPDHITILAQLREALPSNNKLLTFRSSEYGNLIVHMYPMQCLLKNPDVGAVLDTGNASAAKHTHTSLEMQAAFRAAHYNERHLDGLLHRGHSSTH
jgi:hypothetical protein